MFKPAKDRILVKPLKKEEKETTAGILLPGTVTDEKALRGEVVVTNYLDVNIGDQILYSKFGYDEAEIDGETHHVVSLANILGIFA